MVPEIRQIEVVNIDFVVMKCAIDKIGGYYQMILKLHRQFNVFVSRALYILELHIFL